ncbi:MAG: DUF2236 domain-containing protein [Acidobacteria bacterium]|nr:DUF2236 domain-containing protein [Acidobacteriota bacterium]
MAASPLPSTAPAVGAALDAVVQQYRVQLGRGLRGFIAGEGEPIRDLVGPVEGDPGLFGPDSVTWRVHSDGAMLIAGIRALLLQIMHPLAMAGVADHSDYRHHPEARLARTSQFVATTTFGTTEQAHEAVGIVKRVHARVVGHAPDGRPYAASDPHLISWVHHAEVDSFLAAYQRYGARPLTDAEADRYVAEMAIICELLDGEPPARSVAELRQYFAAIAPELQVGQQGRDAARWLLFPPVPLAVRPAYAVLAPAAIGLLPAETRRALRLPLLPGVDPLLVQPAARAIVRTLGWAITGLAEHEHAQRLAA